MQENPLPLDISDIVQGIRLWVEIELPLTEPAHVNQRVGVGA